MLGWWAYGLFDLDEGFYAAVTGEMLRRGEWITPYYNGSPWFEKPILLYWLGKISVLCFGEVIGPRLPSILATIATYVIVVIFARRHLKDRAAAYALAILSTSFLFVAVGRMMMTDAVLVFCLTAAVFTFYESLVGQPSWRLVTAFALGLSVLAKGPFGLILFVIFAGLTYWREPEFRPRFRGFWVAGTIILFFTIAVWYLPCYLVNREVFVQKFLIEQNINRFAGGDDAHKVTGALNWFFYVIVVLIGMMPWSFWLPSALIRNSSRPISRFVARWGLMVFVLFTISGSKLPHYILAAFPFFALMIAELFASSHKAWHGKLAFGWTLFIFAFLQIGFMTYYYGGSVGSLILPGNHAEVHRIARELKGLGKPVIVYQMPRRDKAKGTGTANLQETSHPSFPFYLGSSVQAIENFPDLDLEKLGPVSYLVTRAGRIPEEGLTYNFTETSPPRRLLVRPIALPIPINFYRVFLCTQELSNP